MLVRMRAGKAAKCRAGGFGGGWAPYGYSTRAGHLIADPHEQAGWPEPEHSERWGFRSRR